MHSRTRVRSRVTSMVLVVLAVISVPVAARATDCPRACAARTVTCVKAARMNLHGCRLACRVGVAVADRSSCLRACGEGFAVTRWRCGPEHARCLAVCNPQEPDAPPGPPPPRPCRAQCGRALATCSIEAAMSARSCQRGCRTAPDRLECHAECAGGVRRGADDCAVGLKTCVAGCGGSPSGAFLDPPGS